MRLDRRGRPRPEGYRMAVYDQEAEVVLRIFRSFADGTSIKALVSDLNTSGTPGRKGLRNRWSPSTVSRILKNEKYVGRWLWNRTETRRDPLTGRKRRLRKPEAEWHLTEDPELRIVPDELWQRVVERWREVDRVWPVARTKRDGSVKQRSYVETNPPHLLSGILRCGACGRSRHGSAGRAAATTAASRQRRQPAPTSCSSAGVWSRSECSRPSAKGSRMRPRSTTSSRGSRSRAAPSRGPAAVDQDHAKPAGRRRASRRQLHRVHRRREGHLRPGPGVVRSRAARRGAPPGAERSRIDHRRRFRSAAARVGGGPPHGRWATCCADRWRGRL